MRFDYCQYPLTDAPPHVFCGEPTDGRAYCPEHDALCHAGPGKDWQAIAGMMKSVEQTIRPTPGLKKGEEQVRAIDEVLRGAKIDKPGGLMGRT